MYPEHRIDAEHMVADPVFYDTFYGQRTSSWRHTANPEVTVLMSAEVIDLMMELILLMTSETVRLQVCCPLQPYTIQERRN